ncbi:MAG: TIGR00730 family Rossman fold protein [Geobacter sp.]|nr:MAG: TIGR00730 family Rossman fold protein [Geobacter sp.]
MNKICVFCGSRPGLLPEYVEAAAELGRILAAMEMGLVYGGGGIGLMRIIAESVLDAGGHVTGIIPRALAEKEIALTRLDDLRIVSSMHERKALMAELSDGFIALPGGIGTIEEFVEVLTWAQLGIHHKPCGLLNISGYYDQLLAFFDHMADHGFISRESLEMVLVDDDPERLLMRMNLFRSPEFDKVAWALGMGNV